MMVVASAARRARYWASQSGDVDLGGQERLQRHRGRELTGADQATSNVVGLLVDRLEEMLGFEEIADPIERLVVDEDRAQEGLLRLDIVRRTRYVGGEADPPACAISI